MIKMPPFLKRGNTIGLTCPAGYMPPGNAATCIATLQQWGYKVMKGKTLDSDSGNYFSGTDEERRSELQAMLDDDDVHAILCARGGYGTSRIIDGLNFKKFKKQPKWIIGFSDITLLHAHILRTCNIAGIHAPMAAAFNDGGAGKPFVLSLKKVLTGKKNSYACIAHPFNKQGTVTGVLAGGNLALFTHIIGTVSDVKTDNKILFFEDTGEYIYAADRMLMQLKRSGKLSNLAGLVVGGFTEMKDTIRPFGKSIYEAIIDILTEYNYPVCFDFPVGHGTENYALKIGGSYRLTIGSKEVRLVEE